MNENLYEILGLNKNATAEEIKASYRRLAMLYHPDKNKGDKEKEEKFKKISFAYDTLGDTTKKQQYDTQSPHGKTYQPNPFGAFGGGVDDIFNTFFGGNPFGGGGPFGGFHQQTHFHQEFNENLDITVNVVITLTDVYKAKPIKVSYKRYILSALAIIIPASIGYALLGFYTGLAADTFFKYFKIARELLLVVIILAGVLAYFVEKRLFKKITKFIKHHLNN